MEPGACAQVNVQNWLAAKGLAELAPIFIEKKYTDVAAMDAVGIDDDDLNYLGIHDKQHRAVLKGEVLQDQNTASEVNLSSELVGIRVSLPLFPGRRRYRWQ